MLKFEYLSWSLTRYRTRNSRSSHEHWLSSKADGANLSCKACLCRSSSSVSTDLSEGRCVDCQTWPRGKCVVVGLVQRSRRLVSTGLRHSSSATGCIRCCSSFSQRTAAEHAATHAANFLSVLDSTAATETSVTKCFNSAIRHAAQCVCSSPTATIVYADTKPRHVEFWCSDGCPAAFSEFQCPDPYSFGFCI